MQPTSPYIKALSILHYALLAGQFLMGIIIFGLVWLKKENSFPLENLSQQLLIACVVIAVLAYLGANLLFKKKLEHINAENNPVSKKLEEYRAANITRWAIVELATLFCIIIFFVTGNYSIMIVAAVMLFLFFTTKPGAEKTIAELNISMNELDENGGDGNKNAWVNFNFSLSDNW